MYLLVAVLFGVLYGVLVGLGAWSGYGNTIMYLAMALVLLGIQYLIGPVLVGWTMGVKYVTEQQEPALHQTGRRASPRSKSAQTQGGHF